MSSKYFLRCETYQNGTKKYFARQRVYHFFSKPVRKFVIGDNHKMGDFQDIYGDNESQVVREMTARVAELRSRSEARRAFRTVTTEKIPVQLEE